jgi:hypothetical protein
VVLLGIGLSLSLLSAARLKGGARRRSQAPPRSGLSRFSP